MNVNFDCCLIVSLSSFLKKFSSYSIAHSFHSFSIKCIISVICRSLFGDLFQPHFFVYQNVSFFSKIRFV